MSEGGDRFLPPDRLAAALLAIALLAAGSLLAEGGMAVAALPLAAWALAPRLASAPRLELRVTRVVEGIVRDRRLPLTVSVRIENLGPRAAALELADRPPLGALVLSGPTTWAGSLDGGASVTLVYELRLPRGVHDFGTVAARAERLFSGAATVLDLPCPTRVTVLADPLQAWGPAFASPSPRPFAGLSRSRRRGGGCDFSGLRQYAAGDRLRDINWRAEALWGQVVVNTFEEERALDAGVILDARAAAYSNEAHFEAAVSAASAMARLLLDGGSRVAFLRYGAVIGWTPPGSGRRHRLELELAAARTRLGSHAAFERFDNLPVKLFPPGSLVLLVSPLLPGDLPSLRSIKALGYSLALLRPDPLPLEMEDAAVADIDAQARDLAQRTLRLEAGVLLSRLAAAGIELIDWNPALPLSSARSTGPSPSGRGVRA